MGVTKMSKLINFIKLPFDIADGFGAIGGGIYAGGGVFGAPTSTALLQLGQAVAPSGKFVPQLEQNIVIPPLK